MARLSRRTARSSCQNKNPEQTIASPTDTPLKLRKDCSSRSPGATQESPTNTVMSVALAQNTTATTPTTRLIGE
jgi:hypothetical protein